MLDSLEKASSGGTRVGNSLLPARIPVEFVIEFLCRYVPPPPARHCSRFGSHHTPYHGTTCVFDGVPLLAATMTASSSLASHRPTLTTAPSPCPSPLSLVALAAPRRGHTRMAALAHRHARARAQLLRRQCSLIGRARQRLCGRFRRTLAGLAVAHRQA